MTTAAGPRDDEPYDDLSEEVRGVMGAELARDALEEQRGGD